MVAALQRAGATPLPPVQEVDDPTPLDPEAARRELEVAQRARAAQLRTQRSSFLGLFHAPSPAAPPAGAVTVACVRCGAPNPHRPGARDESCGHCGAAIIPSDAAPARGLAQSARAAAEGRRQAIQHHRRRADAQERVVGSLRTVQLALLLLGTLAGGAVVISAGVSAVVEGHWGGLVPVCINGA